MKDSILKLLVHKVNNIPIFCVCTSNLFRELTMIQRPRVWAPIFTVSLLLSTAAPLQHDQLFSGSHCVSSKSPQLANQDQKSENTYEFNLTEVFNLLLIFEKLDKIDITKIHDKIKVKGFLNSLIFSKYFDGEWTKSQKENLNVDTFMRQNLIFIQNSINAKFCFNLKTKNFKFLNQCQQVLDIFVRAAKVPLQMTPTDPGLYYMVEDRSSLRKFNIK